MNTPFKKDSRVENYLTYNGTNFDRDIENFNVDEYRHPVDQVFNNTYLEPFFKDMSLEMDEAIKFVAAKIIEDKDFDKAYFPTIVKHIQGKVYTSTKIYRQFVKLLTTVEIEVKVDKGNTNKSTYMCRLVEKKSKYSRELTDTVFGSEDKSTFISERLFNDIMSGFTKTYPSDMSYPNDYLSGYVQSDGVTEKTEVTFSEPFALSTLLPHHQIKKVTEGMTEGNWVRMFVTPDINAFISIHNIAMAINKDLINNAAFSDVNRSDVKHFHNDRKLQRKRIDVAVNGLIQYMIVRDLKPVTTGVNLADGGYKRSLWDKYSLQSNHNYTDNLKISGREIRSIVSKTIENNSEQKLRNPIKMVERIVDFVTLEVVTSLVTINTIHVLYNENSVSLTNDAIQKMLDSDAFNESIERSTELEMSVKSLHSTSNFTIDTTPLQIIFNDDYISFQELHELCDVENFSHFKNAIGMMKNLNVLIQEQIVKANDIKDSTNLEKDMMEYFDHFLVADYNNTTTRDLPIKISDFYDKTKNSSNDIYISNKLPVGILNKMLDVESTKLSVSKIGFESNLVNLDKNELLSHFSTPRLFDLSNATKYKHYVPLELAYGNIQDVIEDENELEEAITLQKEFITELQQLSESKPEDLYIDNVQWKVLVRNCMRNKNTLITGESGTGKTTMVYKIAEMLGRPVHYVNLGSTQDARTSLLGSMHYNKENGTYFKKSEFINAIQQPNTIILMDELSRANFEAKNILLPALDTNLRTLTIEETNEVIEIDPTVTFFATANIGSKYSATRMIDRAMLDRFYLTEVETLSSEENRELLNNKFPLNIDENTKLAKIFDKVNSEYRDEESMISQFLSTRVLIEAASLAQDGFTVNEIKEQLVLPLFEGGNFESERSYVNQIFEQLS